MYHSNTRNTNVLVLRNESYERCGATKLIRSSRQLPPCFFCASMLALDVQLAGPAIQLPAAALGELALGELALGAWAEPGAWAAPGGGKVRLKVNCKRSNISDACTACRRSKVKCEEEKPCARCISHGWRDSCVSWRKVKASRTQEPGADGADTLQRSGAVQSLFGMLHGVAFGGMFATPKMPPAPTSVVACSGAASRDESPRTLSTSVVASRGRLRREGNILIHNTSASMVQLPAAALGALALGAWAEPGAWAAPGAGDDGADGKVGRKRSSISDACTACRRSKVKCQEEKPCARCISHGWRDSCVSWHKVKASRSQAPGADGADTLLATPKMPPAPTSATLSTSVVAGAASRGESQRTSTVTDLRARASTQARRTSPTRMGVDLCAPDLALILQIMYQRERERALLGTIVHNGGSMAAPAARTPHHHALSFFPTHNGGVASYMAKTFPGL